MEEYEAENEAADNSLEEEKHDQHPHEEGEETPTPKSESISSGGIFGVNESPQQQSASK